uniref:pectinesterase n=1 Tax=Nelumbo nucifera TaxID=4432 RepID=A0A822YME6_NELNU|nr:TPA_asm: hypothetical protein HUJ06_012104 [Nelumbo nucifera]
MATQFFSISYFISLYVVLLLSFSHLSLAIVPPSANVSQDAACRSTPYPYFCKSVLPRNENRNITDYGRFSVRRSLSAARKFLGLVDRYLRNRSNLSQAAIRVLEDCRLLAGLNIDFLFSSFKTLNSTKILPSLEAEDVQTLLSAILTNQQTCSDEIQVTESAWRVRNGMSLPLSNDTKLYSVSLALFTRGWVYKHKGKRRKPKPGRKLIFSDMEVVRHGHLPLRMSRRNREIYEYVGRRKLLQNSMESVLVRDIVVVSQDGNGNFTTINDAVAAAPNNTKIDDGYFLIYIVGGVYEEYVSIAKNKKNLMMIGDGINQTILTGNHSVGDGSTTFNSATLGKLIPIIRSSKSTAIFTFIIIFLTVFPSLLQPWLDKVSSR